MPVENSSSFTRKSSRDEALVPQDAGWVSHFDNTKDWIVTSPGPEGAAVPELPEEAAELKAPLKLWVHGKPNEISATKVIAVIISGGYAGKTFVPSIIHDWLNQPGLTLLPALSASQAPLPNDIAISGL